MSVVTSAKKEVLVFRQTDVYNGYSTGNNRQTSRHVSSFFKRDLKDAKDRKVSDSQNGHALYNAKSSVGTAASFVAIGIMMHYVKAVMHFINKEQYKYARELVS